MAKWIAVLLFLFEFTVGLLPEDNRRLTETSSLEVIPALASTTTGAQLAREPECTNPTVDVGCIFGVDDDCCKGFVCQKKFISLDLDGLEEKLECVACVGENSKCSEDKPCCREYYCSTDAVCQKCVPSGGDCTGNYDSCCAGARCVDYGDINSRRSHCRSSKFF